MSRQDQYMWRCSCRYFQCNHQRWFHILFRRITKDIHIYPNGTFVNLMIVQNMIKLSTRITIITFKQYYLQSSKGFQMLQFLRIDNPDFIHI